MNHSTAGIQAGCATRSRRAAPTGYGVEWIMLVPDFRADQQSEKAATDE